MAVNSVFGVLENMIDQLEKSSNEGDDDESNRSEDEESHILSPSLPTVNDDNYKKTEKRNNVSCQLSNIIMSYKHDDNLNDDSKDVVSNKLGKNMEANNFISSAEISSRRSELNAVGIDEVSSL
ncbi:hypothetical protein Cni_G06543 [Canna indica]|uniref:Uncharacterized protein n=1 Tax=Canna indica TaxID=4628 RepID=A0AAQ3K1S9_9LILI|nr:hypothetical protein Cni_G06543 [Canna indica]